MSSSSSETPTSEETIPSEGQPEDQPSPPVDLGSVTNLAENITSELEAARERPSISPQELEEKLAERKSLLEVQENVFDKLMQMPEIARGRELAALERVRRDTGASVWEALTEESFDRLAAEGVIDESQAKALTEIQGDLQGVRQRAQSLGGRQFLSEKEQAWLDRVEGAYASLTGQLEERIQTHRAEIKEQQEAALATVTERYLLAAEALANTLERYQAALAEIEAHPQVQQRLTEIKAEQERLEALRLAEENLVREAQAAAESVQAKNMSAFRLVEKATGNKEIVQELKDAYHGKGKYARGPKGELAPATQSLYGKVTEALYKAGVKPWQLQPWTKKGTARSYVDDRVLVNNLQVRQLTEEWLKLPEDDPRHQQAQRIREGRHQINADCNILAYRAEDLTKFARGEEKRMAGEAAKKAAEEQRRFDEQIAKVAVVRSETEGGFVVRIPVLDRDQKGKPRSNGARQAALRLVFQTSRSGTPYWRVTQVVGKINGLEPGTLLSLDFRTAVPRRGNPHMVSSYVAASARDSGAFITHGPEFPEFYPRAEETEKE